MKIEKREFDATPEEVAAEIKRIVSALVKAGIVPYISKVKSELKCSEADLVKVLHDHQNIFEIIHDKKGKPGIKVIKLQKLPARKV